MNLDELQSVRDRERQTDKPQQLRESFYADVGGFVEQLRAERERAAQRHDSPYADEVMQLTDEIDAAQQLVEDIHERRIGKVVKAASLEAAELSPEVKGLTTEERDLFEQLVSDIEGHRREVLSTVEGKQSDPTEGESNGDTTSSGPATDGSEVTAADLMGPDGVTPGDDGTETDREPGDESSQESRSAHPSPEDLHPDTPGEAGETASGGTADASTDPPGGRGRARQQEGPDSTVTDRAPAAETDGGNQTDGVASGSNGPTGGTPSVRDSRPGADADDGRSPTTDGESGQEQSPMTDGESDREQSPTTDGESDREQSPAEVGGEIERDRVLVTENVATFVGSDDRDYDLAAADVVTLPSTNADILVERDAARRL